MKLQVVITSLSVVDRPDLIRGSGDRNDSLSMSEAEPGGLHEQKQQLVKHQQKQKEKEARKAGKGKDKLAPPSSEADEIKKEVRIQGDTSRCSLGSESKVAF